MKIIKMRNENYKIYMKQNALELNADVKLPHMFFVFYYFILFIIALSWTNRELIMPAIEIRILYSSLLIVPLFIYPNLLTTILIIFVSIRLFSVAPYGYLPTATPYYLVLAIVLYLYSRMFGKLYLSKNNYPLIILFGTVILSNVINFNFELNFIIPLAVTILLSKFISSKNDILLMGFGFTLVTFSLSIYALIFYQEFIVQIQAASNEIDVLRWTDTNYLGGLISIGMIIAFNHILNNSKQRKIYKLFNIITFVFGIITIAMLASRGAFIALVVSIFYLLYKKLNSFKNIILIIVFTSATVYFLAQTDLFYALIERFSDKSFASGSSRTIIWKNAFSRFINSDIKILLFGGGTDYSLSLSGQALGQKSASPHNNFLQILFDYGVIGFTAFVIIIFKWFKINKKQTILVSLILFFVVLCMTLVPLMYLPFWLLILLISTYNNQVEKNVY